MTCLNNTEEHCRTDAAGQSACANGNGAASCGDRKCSSFFGWEWLEMPGLIMIVIGMLGLLSVATKKAAWLKYLNFPPVWSCCIIVIGSVLLLAVASIAYMRRCEKPITVVGRKSWRSL